MHVMYLGPMCSAGAEIYSGEGAPSWWECRESNLELLRNLREDLTSAEIHRLTVDDAEKGRMSEPCEASEVNLDKVSDLSATRCVLRAIAFFR